MRHIRASEAAALTFPATGGIIGTPSPFPYKEGDNDHLYLPAQIKPVAQPYSLIFTGVSLAIAYFLWKSI